MLELASLTDPNTPAEWGFLAVIGSAIVGAIASIIVAVINKVVDAHVDQKVAEIARDGAIREPSMSRFALNQREKRRLYARFMKAGDRAAKIGSTTDQQEDFQNLHSKVILFATDETENYLAKLSLPTAFAVPEQRKALLKRLKQDVTTQTT